ncbi:MAG: pirin family protein [Peptoniphilus sp.]|nr:pirin family protein [Peptoniphilus sp.]MDY3118242.1 pirin family protein [Peptoniphilus sp.]
MIRTIQRMVHGEAGVDGAGVHLKHVLNHSTVKDADPLLLLDAFDSKDPEDYVAGFPMHPHRGIETISYVVEGTMVHRDSLGNEDAVSDGGVQWMTAGSGIFHEEMIPPADHLFGVQLWLNLKKKDKFAPPAYVAIPSEDIQDIPFDGGYLRLLAGRYEGHEGHLSAYQPLDYYDVHIEPGKQFRTKVDNKASATLFALLGSPTVQGEAVTPFEAAILTEGDEIVIDNDTDEVISVLVFISEPVEEPVAWWGPIVMNTEKELEEAFEEMRKGTFVKEEITMSRE